jgi:hypothetical protein
VHFVIGWPGSLAVIAVAVYRAAGPPGHRLNSLRTENAEAVLALRPDPRRHPSPDDIRARPKTSTRGGTYP